MTLQELRKEITKRLDAGEATELIRFFLGVSQSDILFAKAVDEQKLPALLAAVKRRESGEPLQYILGEWDFCGRRILCRKGVLIPREDTETLCQCGENFLKEEKEPLILEICAGSGAVGLTLAAFGAKAVLTDIAPEALALAADNAKLFSVEERVLILPKDARKDSDYSEVFSTFAPEKSAFDAIFSNPPYIPREELQTLSPSVLDYEPMLALDGGEDGLCFYRTLCAYVPNLLKDGGLFAVEIGQGQESDVVKLFEAAGFSEIEFARDLAGIIRVVSGKIRN